MLLLTLPGGAFAQLPSNGSAAAEPERFSFRVDHFEIALNADGSVFEHGDFSWHSS